MKRIISLTLNLSIFLVLSAVIGLFWWKIIGEIYLFSDRPIGGDYFNSLTYQTFFAKHLSLPPTGWLSFWHEGVPVVGGYPWLTFYLAYPLTKFFDIATAMDIFSVASLLVFYLASLLLFQQVSKNWLIAGSLTLVIIGTRATYNALTTGAFINSATAQWYLPIVLLFIYRFGETVNFKYLILASIFSGLSLIHHAPTSVLLIILPVILILILYPQILPSFKRKISDIFIFLTISTAIGSMGLYNLLLQIFSGSGTDACQSPHCWGIYPLHFIVWLTPISPLLVLVLFAILLIIKFFRKHVDFYFVLSSIAGLAVPVLYTIAARLKLINSLANVFFPTRTFWAANLFLLLIAASLFFLLKKAVPKFSHVIALVTTIVIFLFVYANPPEIHKEVQQAVPDDIGHYIIPKYQTKSLSELVPNWMLHAETNWRLDSFHFGVTQWWNVASEVPMTRGYSNYPIGTQRDWLYFFQVSTREVPKDQPEELVKNRALFLLDAYGVKFIDNSMASYPPSIINDPEIISNRDSQWYELSPQVATPLVSPTNSPVVLFVGDDVGYNNFIRAISMTNLNSKILIPVKGPTSLGKLTKEDSERSSTLILYRYSGSKSDFDRIYEFVKNGGKVFIESGSALSHQSGKLSNLFPIETLAQIESSQPDNYETQPSKISEQINIQSFSPLRFQDGPWKLFTTKGDVRPWAKSVINYNNQPVVVEGSLGKGYVIWSGLNLPYHIRDYNNLEEAKLFKNIILTLIEKGMDKQPEFQVKRPKPEKIEVEGSRFKGVYFKENYHPGWKAKINDQEAKIYKAGLGFMYIPLSNTEDNPSVLITFTGSFVTWSLFWLTILVLAVSFLYLIFPRSIRMVFGKISQIFMGKIGRKASGWWEREEE